MAEESNDTLDQSAAELWNLPVGEIREQRLVVHYMPFVRRSVSVAISRNPNLDRDDATQEALIRLLQCIRKFDPANGAAFTTYATLAVTGGTLDAARAADWVPSKARAADREDQKLPVMFPWQDGFDCKAGTDAVVEAAENVRELLEAVKGTAVERDVALWLHCNGNLDDMATSLGVSVEQATILWKSAAEKLRDPQAYMAEVANLPAYVPPTEEATVQQTLF